MSEASTRRGAGGQVLSVGDAVLANASDGVRARMGQAYYEYDQQALVEEQERERLREIAREKAFRASIAAAESRGELVDMGQGFRDGGNGRTPSEAVAYMSAVADLEDAKAAALQRKAFEEWRGEQFYADVP